MRERFIMTIKIIDFQSYKDVINKFDEITADENLPKISITFPHNKDVSKKIDEFLRIAYGEKPE